MMVLKTFKIRRRGDFLIGYKARFVGIGERGKTVARIKSVPNKHGFEDLHAALKRLVLKCQERGFQHDMNQWRIHRDLREMMPAELVIADQ